MQLVLCDAFDWGALGDAHAVQLWIIAALVGVCGVFLRRLLRQFDEMIHRSEEHSKDDSAQFARVDRMLVPVCKATNVAFEPPPPPR